FLLTLSELEKQSPRRARNARPHRSLEAENNASAFGLGIFPQPVRVLETIRGARGSCALVDPSSLSRMPRAAFLLSLSQRGLSPQPKRLASLCECRNAGAVVPRKKASDVGGVRR